ncbi:MAG: tRNA lysidine(34) synthetase TilS [Desulfobacterales bacterium]|nr:tRNA lysidine(34) synthetase TilS [Desulfobacterales bacterium]
MTSTLNAPENSRIRRRVLDTVKRTIADYKMVFSGNALLVGVSGGPDSMALLHILQHLAPEYGLRLAVAHLNHGLRKEADDEAEFVATASARLGLACHIKKEDVSRYRHRHRLSLEEAGRLMRYAFYDDVATRHHFDKIALGHQADDNAELVLMFLIRGSGPVGFAGIPPVRADRIIRPLIRLSRRDILDYLKAVGLAYVTDRTNRDMRFMRNRIRGQLVPLLRRSYNPKISEALNRLADIQREEQAWIEEIADTLYRDVRLTGDAHRRHLSIAQLVRQPKAAQRRIIRKAIVDIKGDLRRISFAHVRAAVDLLSVDRQDGRLDLPDGIALERIGNTLRVSKKSGPARPKPGAVEEIYPATFCYGVKKPDEVAVIVTVAEIDYRVIFSTVAAGASANLRQAGQQVAFFDIDSLIFPLTLRNVRAGDRFRPFGLQGTQKIKKYFIDHKVPREKRRACPVLLSGGRIIWLMGHRMAEDCHVTPATREILRAEITCLAGDRD